MGLTPLSELLFVCLLLGSIMDAYSGLSIVYRMYIVGIKRFLKLPTKVYVKKFKGGLKFYGRILNVVIVTLIPAQYLTYLETLILESIHFLIYCYLLKKY
jgi:hypothetical protein